MNELEKKLGYTFHDKNLLTTALTHSSYANENRRLGIESNERLEFLGDSVLGMITAEYIFKTFPNMPEGKMTKFRAELVCEQNLHRVAEKLSIGKYLLLGHGEEQNGGRNRVSMLADSVEAIIAAIYLDSGREEAVKMIDRFILSEIDKENIVISHDYKTLLQEHVQKNGSVDISYRLTGESGPDHNKLFTVAVFVQGVMRGEGSGRSKKEAEQEAAKKALEESEK